MTNVIYHKQYLVNKSFVHFGSYVISTVVPVIFMLQRQVSVLFIYTSWHVKMSQTLV